MFVVKKQHSDSTCDSYHQVKTRLLELQAKAEELLPITKQENFHCDWFILLLLLATPTIWFSLDLKWQSHEQSRKKMEMFWLFLLQFQHACDFAYNTDFHFHKVISTLATPLTIYPNSDSNANEIEPSALNQYSLHHEHWVTLMCRTH